MLKIGDFSRLTNIPIKTLRYYDEIGLLKSASVESENKYRYYGTEQLIELNKILALKDAGFSLQEINFLLRGRISRDELLDLLNGKLSVAEHELAFANRRLSNLRTRINYIQNEEIYQMVDISIKRVESILVASIRKQGLGPGEMSAFYDVIFKDIARHGVKEIAPIMMLRHDGHDEEVIAQIDREYTSDHPDIRVYRLPAVERMACMVFRGDWGEPIRLAMEQMLKQMQESGLQYTYPSREIYHYGERENPDWICPIPYGVFSDPSKRKEYEVNIAPKNREIGSTFITEVQYPIK
jgi:DNA-binding transcriptional MerR regulator